MSRIYTAFPEAFNEIRRDLAEMGATIHTSTMQDKNIVGNEDFTTLELQNYMYTVTHPRFLDLNPIQPWANSEWLERLHGIQGKPINPGNAYKLRPEIWDEFLHEDRFAYTYGERFNQHGMILNIIERLKEDPNSRQCYAPMFAPKDTDHLGTARVPCSLGWHFQFRNGGLNMTYMMRSCDFSTHFQNDVFLSLQLLNYVAERSGLPMGWFSHMMFSLHVYQKDVKDVF